MFGQRCDILTMAGVVLLHGISRTAASMRKIEHRLAAAGYHTANWTYPSRRHDLATIAEQLAPKLAMFAEWQEAPIHFVTHSMGGLVLRALLARYRPPGLGRVVMLAPPNGGSELADRLHFLPPYRWWFGPAGKQLVTDRNEESTTLFGTIDFELGIIAGRRSLYPLASLLLPRPNDGRVSVAATMVEGMTDHLTLPTTHPTIVRDPLAIEQVLAFLRDGRFRRPD